MALLFEYGNWETIKNKSSLKLLLEDTWQQKIVDNEIEINESEQDSRYQPFLSFDGDKIKANNFVGFIQNGEEIIEIYPKVFKTTENPIAQKMNMLHHIFYWFSYCRKWRFPFNRTYLDTNDIDSFPELIINLIANQFLETVSKLPLNLYQPIEEALQTPRGTVNFKRYINNSFSHGKFHQIECDYEPFVFDNKANRIIKYCTRVMLNQTKFPENSRMLQEVIFILDEVEDVPCNALEVDNVRINSFFEEYLLIMDSCRLILNKQLYSNNTYDLSQWCLLFPMEYIFEDFIAGFLETHFCDKWNVHYQKSEMNLSNFPPVFRMQHDIFLTSKDETRTIIVDTKYKIRNADFKSDAKRGIQQSDLYQMVSYAFKRGCNEVILLYPNISEKINEPDYFEITSGFNSAETIKVKAMEVPFYSLDHFHGIGDKLLYELAKI